MNEQLTKHIQPEYLAEFVGNDHSGQAIIQNASIHGLSWFCSPRKAILWLGRTGWRYPHSFELTPLVANPVQTSGVNFAIRVEGNRLFKLFSFNPHYYTIDYSLEWSKLTNIE
jgi:hypothetical protein